MDQPFKKKFTAKNKNGTDFFVKNGEYCIFFNLKAKIAFSLNKFLRVLKVLI